MSQKISKECLTHAVKLINCQFNLNLTIKEKGESYTIAPENDITQLEGVYISIEKSKNGYSLNIENADNRLSLDKFSKIVGKTLESFSMVLEDDALCDIPSILCKLAKIIWS